AFPARRSSSYYSYGQQLDADALCRLIRLAIYANDEAGFIADRELHDKELAPHRASHLLALLFAGVPLATEWLTGRRVAIQLALFEAKLSAVLETGGARRAVLQHDVRSGTLRDVRGGIARAEDATGVTQQALEATVAFLEGRNEAALQYYRDALKLRRKQAGKRKLFLEGPHGLFFLMALLRANDAGLHAEMQAGIDAALSTPSVYASGFLALQALLWLVQGLEPQAREQVRRLR